MFDIIRMPWKFISCVFKGNSSFDEVILGKECKLQLKPSWTGNTYQRKTQAFSSLQANKYNFIQKINLNLKCTIGEGLSLQVVVCLCTCASDRQLLLQKRPSQNIYKYMRNHTHN